MDIQKSRGKRLVETDPIHVYDPSTNKSYMRCNADGTSHPMKCEWGYGRVSLLKHLTANKHHFTRMESSGLTRYAPSGRVRGGSVKVGIC
jgi:hypothetical protein